MKCRNKILRCAQDDRSGVLCYIEITKGFKEKAMALTLEKIRAARERIAPYIVKTPLLRLPALDEYFLQTARRLQ